MRLPYRNKKVTLWVLFGVIVITMFLFKFTELRPTCLFKVDATNELSSQMVRVEKYLTDDNQRVYSYNREMPLIFIGGVPRSGTTLMRAMLDAHPDVRCGQETRVIPRILQLRSHWLKSEKESLRLQEAGITKEVMNSAIAQFCLEIIAKHGEPAPRLCNKDPLTLKMGSYVIELFPNAKFLFMVRDGRATVHSIISRKVTITGFDLSSYRQCMQKWNHAIEVMHEQCRDIGKDRCMMVYYEQLVLHPEEWMRKILKFLDVPWNDAVLHHEEFINKPNGVPLSKVERSSDQVIKPVNLEAMSKWVGQIPGDVVRDMADIAPMLSVLGYDPYANPPDYANLAALCAVNPDEYRAPVSIFASGNLCLPYLSLPYMDLLSDPMVLSYVIGTSNVLFQQKRQLADVLVDIEAANLDSHDPELRRQLVLSTEDLRYMDYIMKHVQSPKEDAEGSEYWIREQFQGYILALLRTAVAPDATPKDNDHFNAHFMAAFKRTQCFQEWYDVRPEPEFFEALPAGHPFAGTLSVADMKLKLAQTMQNSESGRKINQAVNTTSRAVGGAISQAKGAFSSWWSSITTPPANANTSATNSTNGQEGDASEGVTAQEISVTFQNHKDVEDLDVAGVSIHLAGQEEAHESHESQVTSCEQPQGIVEIGREAEMLDKAEPPEEAKVSAASQAIRPGCGGDVATSAVERSSGDVFIV